MFQAVVENVCQKEIKRGQEWEREQRVRRACSGSTEKQEEEEREEEGAAANAA